MTRSGPSALQKKRKKAVWHYEHKTFVFEWFQLILKLFDTLNLVLEVVSGVLDYGALGITKHINHRASVSVACWPTLIPVPPVRFHLDQCHYVYSAILLKVITIQHVCLHCRTCSMARTSISAYSFTNCLRVLVLFTAKGCFACGEFLVVKSSEHSLAMWSHPVSVFSYCICYRIALILVNDPIVLCLTDLF